MDTRVRIIDVVSANGGRMKLESLKQAFLPIAGLLPTVLQVKPFSTSVDANGEDWVSITIGDLKLCEQNSRDGECTDSACPDLHLCKYFVLNKCGIYDSQCKFGHDVGGRNGQLLSQYGLGNLTRNGLQCIFRNNRTKVTIPSICTYYNNIIGCNKPVEGKKACRQLHVCKHFLFGECKFGDACKRSHGLVGSSHTQAILQSYGIVGPLETDILNCFKQVKIAESVTVSAQPPSPGRGSMSSVPNVQSSGTRKGCAKASLLGNSPAVCTYNLGDKCDYNNSCCNRHCSLPYQWQTEAGDDWRDVDDPMNALLEMKYCSVPCRQFSFDGTSVDFRQGELTIAGKSLKIRRLETVSAAKYAHRLFASEWTWYWEDMDGTWKIYGQEGLHGYKAAIDSDQIEVKYQDFLDNGDPQMKFATPSYEYIIHFKKMEQENLTTLVRRSVYRRPREHVTMAALKVLRQGRLKPTANSAGSSDMSLPKEWIVTAGHDGNSLVKVSSTTTEYQGVVDAFSRTMPTSTIKEVIRIQNRQLWVDYARMQKKMKDKAALLGVQINEQNFLFHGTTDEKICAISQQGFDFRVAGLSSGTAYGRGAYFHKDASYCEKYTNGCKTLLVGKVLVGEYAVGDSSLCRPPPKNPSNVFGPLYDSVVDNVVSPSIYVIFDNSQSYPAYLIHYDI